MDNKCKLLPIYSPPDPIKGLVSYRKKVLVFTENTIYVVCQPTWFERTIDWLKGKVA